VSLYVWDHVSHGSRFCGYGFVWFKGYYEHGVRGFVLYFMFHSGCLLVDGVICGVEN
jgi:hypothetical protein